MPFTEIGEGRPVRDLPGGHLRPPPEGAHRRHALEEAARKVDVAARIRLRRRVGRRSEATRRGPTWRRSTGGGSCPGCSSTRPSATLGVELFGRRHESPLLVAPIGVLSMAHDEADLAVARARPRAGGHPDPQHPGLGADGGGRRAPWVARGTGTSSTGAATTTSSRASSRGPRRAAARRSSSRSTRHTSAGARATSTSGTCRSPAARASPSTRRTPCSGGSSPSGSRPRRGADAEPRPRPTPAAVRTLVSLSRNHPGGTRAQPHGPRAARRGRDVPRRVLPAVADAGTTCRGCAR